MIDKLKGIINYLWVGAFPNAMAGYDLSELVEGFSEGRPNKCLLETTFLIGWILMGLSKYENYQRIKMDLEYFGWDERLITSKCYSWCDRHSVKQAVKQSGYLEEYEDFLKKEGHKWYHFFPKVHRFKEVR
ncbi:MAG: hypothetical protein Q8L27_04385 [archaeon]|nr:hypothetical protein [archaeon]